MKRKYFIAFAFALTLTLVAVLHSVPTQANPNCAHTVATGGHTNSSPSSFNCPYKVWDQCNPSGCPGHNVSHSGTRSIHSATYTYCTKCSLVFDPNLTPGHNYESGHTSIPSSCGKPNGCLY